MYGMPTIRTEAPSALRTPMMAVVGRGYEAHDLRCT
jgi:hypothetical protein